MRPSALGIFKQIQERKEKGGSSKSGSEKMKGKLMCPEGLRFSTSWWETRLLCFVWWSFQQMWKINLKG